MAGPTTAGRRLGRYHLGDPLGGGPCGAVYRAKVYGVAGFERQFAVKRFHPALVAQPIVSQRLSQAARAYGSLEHPRIARLHEYGVAGGEVFTATEMVNGLDTMRLIATTHGLGAPLPPGAALALVTQAARAVGYAHGRGVNHLGVCPTNVIVMPDGDVKVTDFGILAQTFTMRPSDDRRLDARIHYLAPEQLVNEPSSAATDVFAFGAVLHELLTGEKAFVGVTSLDVEHAILSGHVRDAGLPKPIARVLARCFARSPFERFPDARALADAVDAALRVSPVVGGKRELGQVVKESVARLEAMNEGQLSGAMPLAMPTAPTPAPSPRSQPRAMTSDQPTTIRDPAASRPPPLNQTMRGTVAPPIVRRNATKPPSAGPIAPVALRTPQGTVPVPVGSVPPIVDEDSEDETLQRDPVRSPSVAPVRTRPMPSAPLRSPNASPPPFQTGAPAGTTGLGSPNTVDSVARTAPLRLDSAWPTDEVSAIPDGSAPLLRVDGERLSEPSIEVVDDGSGGVPVPPDEVVRAREASHVSQVAPLAAPSAPRPHRESEAQHRLAVSEHLQVPPPLPSQEGRSGAWKALLFLVVCAALGIGGVLAWNTWLRDRSAASAAPDEVAATAREDETGAAEHDVTPATTDAAGTKPDDTAVAADATVAAVATADAGAAAPPPTGPTVGPTDALLIESTPPGARVFVDGADQGVTPARLPASSDRHSIAMVLPGHDLYTAEVDGSGLHRGTLVEITPPAGPAGIKVKCKDKERYYVYVDGKPTGQMCPTERIGVDVGEHTVEVYDLVSEERRSYPAKVKGTRVSLRVKVDADD